MQNLIISDTNVRQDTEGRYCLNDLHRAAMEREKATIAHRPGSFLRRPDTIALIAAIEKRCTPGCITPVSKVRGNAQGLAQGTFVTKPLVYAYAMWIDADFNLDVIEAFDRANGSNPNLLAQMHALIAKEVESEVRASFGSHLMLTRKKEIPPLREERDLLELAIQPSLLN